MPLLILVRRPRDVNQITSYGAAISCYSKKGRSRPGVSGEESSDLPKPGSTSPDQRADKVLRRALEKDPGQRFQSASDLAYALDAISTMTGAPVPAAWTRRRRWPRYAAALLSLAALFAAGIWAGRYVWDRPLPSFQRLTFRYGAVAAARFGPDGHTVIYSAAWDGMPRLRLYSGHVDARGATELSVQGQVAAVGPSGEVAFFPNRPYPSLHQAALSPGETLARVPMTGGAPREVLPDVVAADWSPEMFADGRRLAIVRDQAGMRRLEFPIGHVLYQTAYGLRAPRFSRRGDLIALVETIASGDCITVVDLQGRRRLLTQGEDLISSTLGWSPDGNEIWFTAEKRSDQLLYGSWRPALRAVSLSGRERELLRLPQFQTLQDVAPDGRALVTVGTMRAEIIGRPRGEPNERNPVGTRLRSSDQLVRPRRGCAGAAWRGARATRPRARRCRARGTRAPGRTAGPSFEMFRRAYLLPHQYAAWSILRDRLQELSAYAKRTASPETAAVMTDVSAGLEQLAGKLDGFIDPAQNPAVVQA